MKHKIEPVYIQQELNIRIKVACAYCGAVWPQDQMFHMDARPFCKLSCFLIWEKSNPRDGPHKDLLSDDRPLWGC